MAIADPDLALRLAKTVADIYGDATAQVLQIVAKRLATGIDDEDWAIAKLLDVSKLRDEAQVVVERLQVLGPEAVERALGEALKASTTGAKSLGIDATLLPHTNKAAVEVLAKTTVDNLAATHVPILRQTLDIYRSVVAETSGPLVAGVTTRRQAAQQALDRFARRGIGGFVDRAGRRWELESYAEMATRTAATGARVEGRLGLYAADGRDIVIVSDSPSECPLCEPYEGELLSISGASVGERIDGREVVASMDTARADGLFHANCTHDVRPYVSGLTRVPSKKTANPDGYKAKQQQRYLERNVRAAKRVQAVALDDDARAAATRKVTAAQSRLRAHVDEHGLKRQPAREQIGRAR